VPLSPDAQDKAAFNTRYWLCKWQVVAVDLVGSLPTSVRGSNWILVVTDHVVQWADVLASPDVSTPTSGQGYFGLLKQIQIKAPSFSCKL